MLLLAALLPLFATGDAAGIIGPRAAGTATVDLKSTHGAAQQLGSGFIYGIPDNGTSASNAIPANLFTDMAFKASRAGGAQIPARGWVGNQYQGRFDSTLSNYRTTRKYGGDFILLVHDIWGADGASINKYPGDNGDWSELTKFLNQLIADIKKNNMLDGLIIDPWNEPDLTLFWNRPWSQYLEYWGRAYKAFRAGLPTTKISGPSAAHSPNLSRSTWVEWVSYVSKNNAIPDIYSWHQIGSWEGQPDTVVPALVKLRAQGNLPERPLDANEYAWPDEQRPSGTAWYLSQLERWNIRGLRANWGGGSALHDYMGALLGKSGSSYYPNGEWQVYKYYAAMKGDRAVTKASSDMLFDVFATTGSTVKILAGTRVKKAAYDISITGLDGVGLPTSGSISVRTRRFDWNGPTGRVDASVDLGVKTVSYSGNRLVLTYDPPTDATAYAFEFAAGGSSTPPPSTGPPPTTSPPPTSNPPPTTPPPPPPPPPSGCAAMWGQCGGQGFTGPKCCSAGTCKYSNDWYSQCL